jgi:hypothetical protein
MAALLHTASTTAGNPMSTQPLPLVDDITAITKLETQGDAIIIVQDKIAYLNDLSLEGDTPDNVLDIVEVWEKAPFMGN